MRPVVCAVLVLAAAPVAQAQNECEYAPEDAVADTLAAPGYYPLALGNAWEFRTGPLPPTTFGERRREEVIGDTLVGGLRHWVVQTTRFYPRNDDTLIVATDPRLSYRAIGDGGVLIRDLTDESDRFAHPFFSCYQQEWFSVWVGRGGPEDQPVKTFSDMGSYRTYEHGWGPVQISSAGDAFLTYARIGDRERGAPFDDGTRLVVSSEEGPAPLAEPVRVWPNPARDRTTVEVPGGTTEVHLYDALGRLVAVQGVAVGGPVVLSVGGLAPGVYRVRAVARGAAPASTLLTVR